MLAKRFRVFHLCKAEVTSSCSMLAEWRPHSLAPGRHSGARGPHPTPAPPSRTPGVSRQDTSLLLLYARFCLCASSESPCDATKKVLILCFCSLRLKYALSPAQRTASSQRNPDAGSGFSDPQIFGFSLFHPACWREEHLSFFKTQM